MEKAENANCERGNSLGWKKVAWWASVSVGVFVLTLLVYSKSLGLGLLYDDVAMILYFHRPTGFAWYESFMALDNGFVRPVYMLTHWAMWHLAGPWDTAWRLFALSLHALVAVTAGAALGLMAGVKRWAMVAVMVTVALASSAFVTAFYSSNTADSLLALGSLATICGFDRWLVVRDGRWLWGSAAGLLFALMSKETAMVLCGVLALQAWSAEKRTRADWLFVGGATAVCLLFAGMIWWMQKSVVTSYTNQGYSSAGPLVLVRLLGYFTSTLFPGVYVMKPLWGDAGWVRGVSVALQIGTAAVLAWAAAVALARPEARLLRLAAVLTLGALLLVLPTAVVNFDPGPHSPVGRYIYSSMVLVVLAAACAAVWLHRRKPRAWRFGVVVWAGWLIMQPAAVRKSPGTKQYYECARQWQALTGEIRRLSPTWPSMQAVSVFAGEQYGSFPLDEAYANALVRVYFPELMVYYASNRVVAETSCCYVFDGRRLTQVAHEPAGPQPSQQTVAPMQ